MIQLGPQLFTVREYTQTLEGIEKTFRECHEQSYETVQISGFGPVPFADLLALIETYQNSCLLHSFSVRADAGGICRR